MLRRNFIQTAFKLFGSAFILFATTRFASASGSGGGSSSGSGSSPSAPSLASAPSTPSSPSSPSGPSDSLSGSSASDENEQNVLIRDIETDIQDDGLEPVSEDDLDSVLEEFN